MKRKSLIFELCLCGCGKPAMVGKKYAFCHSPETRLRMSISHIGKTSGNKGKKMSKESRLKISKARKGKKLSEEHKQKISLAHIGSLGTMLGRKHTKETLQKMSRASKCNWQNPIKREKHRLALTGLKRTEAFRNHISKVTKKLWQDPIYRKKHIEAMLLGLEILPTKPERRLRNGLNKMFPSEYKYVGDGKVWIGGKCPDFINVNGQKKIIEMFGDYWHSKKRTGRTKEQEESQRIKHFAKYGFRTLIVWQRELQNIKQLKKKLMEFQKKVKI